ncbi:MAG: pilus assembly protein PilM [Pirellulaceae bacterium]|nr:pilus assembly protein PilM [Pirellulaceae bacterium]
MVGWRGRQGAGPIGVDLGSRSIKMVQLTADRTRIREAVCWDIPATARSDAAARTRQLAHALEAAREGRAFRGRDAVFCLGTAELFLQNMRVAQATGDQLRQVIEKEAASRLPFDGDQAELRFYEADTVRQGDALRREVIVLACQKPSVHGLLAVAEAARLNPVAIDAAPAALLRCYSHQFRRSSDEEVCALFMSVGASCTTVVIARGDSPRFIKQVDFGGRQLDEAVSRDLKMKLADAVALRRHSGDRRADRRDPEIAESIAKATRPLLESMANDLAMCMRYYSVTFRGQPLSRVVIGGGEASPNMADWLSTRLDIPCELAEPSRPFPQSTLPGRSTQWDVAIGLALREVK